MSWLLVTNSETMELSTDAVPLAARAAPSTSLSMAAGMVGWFGVPSCPMIMGSPMMLLTMSTPTAPAVWALWILMLKEQVPRTITAIWPVSGVEIAVHPFAGVVV